MSTETHWSPSRGTPRRDAAPPTVVTRHHPHQVHHHLTGVSPRHRNSTGSNSSQGSSGFESMRSGSHQAALNNAVLAQGLGPHSPSSRQSVHSSSGSSGSLGSGSLERLDESGYYSSHVNLADMIQNRIPVLTQGLGPHSPSSRQSVHSSSGSSGSLGSGSLERLDESGYYSSHVNLADMIQNRIPDDEVLAAWLHGLRYEEYLPLFLAAGYDLPTVARMTPEDLTAVGLTKPGHRKRLTAEIHRLNLPETLPHSVPLGGLVEWLMCIGLQQYVGLFHSQGYTTVQQVMELTWEDYEDVGIKKLGHLKKLELAIKKLKTHKNSTASISGSAIGQTGSEVLSINVPPGNRTTAEVRPYQHLSPSGHSPRPQSPQVLMSTFQNPPTSPMLQFRQNGSMNSGFDTFPRRSHVSNLLVTEALVHNGGMMENHGLSLSHQTNRPTVSVKPFSTTPKPRRLSQDLSDCGKQRFSPINIINGLGHSKHHNNYANVEVANNGQVLCEKMDSAAFSYDYDLPMIDGSNCGALNGAVCHSEIYRNDGSRQVFDNTCVSHAGRIQLKLNSPTHKLGMNGEKMAPPPAPPQKPYNVHGPHLTSIALDDSFDHVTVSPAPSMDSIQPPPSITCEASIKTLRTVMTSSSENSPTHFVGQSEASEKSSIMTSSSENSATAFASDQLDSVSTCSSTETLPFAQENVGTIKSKHSTMNNGESPNRRGNVRDLFAQSPNAQSPANTTARRQSSSGASGDVLGDIGCMLQNLTDELEALLLPPTSV